MTTVKTRRERGLYTSPLPARSPSRSRFTSACRIAVTSAMNGPLVHERWLKMSPEVPENVARSYPRANRDRPTSS